MPISRYTNIIICLACFALVSFSITVNSQPINIKGFRSVPLEFKFILPRLQQRTQVPVVLPTRIPLDALVTADGQTGPYIAVPVVNGKFTGAYPSLEEKTLTNSFYEISLDATPDCGGTGACSFGLLNGEKLTPNTPSVPKAYAYEWEDPKYNPVGRSPEKHGPVTLIKGINGYFIPYVCGANCDTSKVFWEQNGYRYMVGIRYASKKTMIDMANSAIENEAF